MKVLIPDFEGNWDALATLVSARPDILNHDTETAPRLDDPRARPKARYARSIELLRHAKVLDPVMPAKSGLMVGLGETRALGLRYVELGPPLRSSYHAPERARAGSLAAGEERTAI